MVFTPDPARPGRPSAAGPRALLGERLLWLGALALVLLCAAVFRDVLGFGLLSFDDDINISLNPHLRSLGSGSLAWAFTDMGYVRRYVPLGWLTLLLVHAASGLSPAGYHAASLILHTLSALAVFWIVARLVTVGLPQASPRQAVGAAWVAAAWWAVHPLRVELAAWASGTLNLQGDFFVLVSFAAALEGAGPLCLAAYACSLLSYPTGLGYVGALVALDAYRSREGLSSPRTWCALIARRGAWLALAIAGGCLALLAEGTATGIWSSALQPHLGIAARLAQVTDSLLISSGRILVPAGLSPVYDTFVDFHPGPLALAGAAAALVLVIAALVLLARQGKWGLLCLCLAFLSLILPYLGWNATLHSPSDRYATLPSVAVAAGLGWSVAAGGAGLLAVVLAATAALGFASARLAPAWRGDLELLRRAEAVMTHPDARAEIELRIGKVHFLRGEFEEAEHVSRRAMAELGMPAASEPLYGVAASRGYAEAAPLAMQHNGLGVAMARAGDPRSAEQHFRAALQISPDFPKANVNLALLLLERGDTEEPLHCYLTVALAPAGSVDLRSLTALLRRLAEAYRSKGRPDMADALLGRAERLAASP